MPAMPEDKQCAQACSPRPGESLAEKSTAANEANHDRDRRNHKADRSKSWHKKMAWSPLDHSCRTNSVRFQTPITKVTRDATKTTDVTKVDVGWK